MQPSEERSCEWDGEEDELDYVTLAKAGGRRDLLRHMSYVRTSDQPLSYPRVDWFDHPPRDTVQQDARTSDQPLAYPRVDWFDHPPRDTVQQDVRMSDQPLSYPRVDWFDHPSPPHRETVQQVSPSRLRLPQVGKRRKRRPHPPPLIVRTTQEPKLPAVTSDPVNLVRLLSMDYQKEWLEDNGKRQEEQRRRLKAKRQAQRRKMIEHTVRARQIAGVDRPTEEKPRFIMKRFANIPSKLSLPRQ